MELIEIINILQQEYPNKVIVDLSEYESEEHQTYKCMRLYQDHNLNRWKFEDGYILETQIHKNGI